MTYFASYFGAQTGGAVAQAYHAGRHEFIIDDVFDIVFAEFEPDGDAVSIWDTYSDVDADQDGVVVREVGDRRILTNVETIDVRLTSQAQGSRNAKRLLDRAVNALEMSDMTSIVRRDPIDVGFVEEIGDNGKEVASQVVEVR